MESIDLAVSDATQVEPSVVSEGGDADSLRVKCPSTGL